MKSTIKLAVIGLLSICFNMLLFSCSGSGSSESSTKEGANPYAGYKAKKINYSGSNYKKFCQAAEKVFEEYRTEITAAVHKENWALVKRELMDYWELVDGLTPRHTGDIWDNERYQNAYDSFAAKILVEEARVLLDKQDMAADDVLIEQILSVQPSPWSTIDDGPYSHSNGTTVMELATPTIIKLAKLKGRTKVLDYLDESNSDDE